MKKVLNCDEFKTFFCFSRLCRSSGRVKKRLRLILVKGFFQGLQILRRGHIRMLFEKHRQVMHGRHIHFVRYLRQSVRALA